MKIVRISIELPSREVRRDGMPANERWVVNRFPDGALQPLLRLRNRLFGEVFAMTFPANSTSIRVDLWNQGWRELKPDMENQFDNFCHSAQERFRDAKNTFLRGYPAAVENARRMLGDMFSIANYPPEESLRFNFQAEVREI